MRKLEEVKTSIAKLVKLIGKGEKIMVNVSKLMGLAGEALSAVKRAPMAQKTAMAAIFGAGAMTGALINCDGFEKEEAKAPTEQVAKKAMTKPKAEAKKEPEFKYVPPKVGEDDVAKADTIYYAGTNQPESILYKDKDGKTVHQTDLDKNGKLKGFYDIYSNGKGKESDYDYFNAKGDFVLANRVNPDGSKTLSSKGHNGNWLEIKYDSKGRKVYQSYEKPMQIEGKTYYSPNYIETKYHKDGSHTVKFTEDNTAITYDKNDRKIKEKKYGYDDVLQYTVIPKYNKDGDIVKNDTIRNK